MATLIRNTRFVLMFVSVTVIAIVYGQQCNVVPKCTCDFDGDVVEVEEQTPMKNEALAGAVGALGSLVISGGGFGIWYLLKNRGGSASDMLHRSDSAISEESMGRGKEGKGPPPTYNSRFGPQAKTPNIYKAGMKDNLSHKVAPSTRRGLESF